MSHSAGIRDAAPADFGSCASLFGQLGPGQP